MNDPSPTSHFLVENPTSSGIPRAAEQAYLGLLAGLSGLATAALLIFAVATQSSADAERIASSNGAGVSALVASFAATHGRPGGR